MIGRGFQIKWLEETEWLHSYIDFKIYMPKKNVPETPDFEIKTIQTGNRILRGEKVYGTRSISVECIIAEKERVDTKRFVMNLMYKLSKPIVLRFDDKLDLIYYAELSSKLDVEEIITIGKFTLRFICFDSFRYSIEKAEALTWDSEMTWLNDLYIDGTGEDTEFAGITEETTLLINNAGTYKALPIIEIEGTADIIHITTNSVTTSYGPINADETIYIDCKAIEITKKINSDITNALLYWQGDFIYLEPGINEVQITGINLNITKLKFDFRHTFL